MPASRCSSRETFWDNRDWDWYKANIPFFECPDADIHDDLLLPLGAAHQAPDLRLARTAATRSPSSSTGRSGPGAYGAISCPAGHQLYEVRWLRDPRYARDYARYWFRTPGAQPRNYSTWLADAVWAVHRVHPDDAFVDGPAPGPDEELRGLGEAALRRRRSACSGRPATTTAWSSTSTAGRRRTSSAARPATGRRSTRTCGPTRWPSPASPTSPATRRRPTRTAPRPPGSRTNLQKKLWDPKRRVLLPHVPARRGGRTGQRSRRCTLTYQTGQVRRQRARPRADRLRAVAVQPAGRRQGLRGRRGRS